MTQCASTVPLTDRPSSAGLFDDVGDLAFGSVKLRVQGHYRCLDVQQALYKFDVIDAAVTRSGR